MHTASGVQLLMACLLYPIELYADFSGYTDMAIGIGMLFGLKLSSNFAHPFAAQTTAEFWRRWHISLSSWVRDYLFLPLSSFTRRWGQWGVAASLMVTFIALGVWHGAGWTFAVYGFIQGLVIVWELRTERIRNKVRKHIGGRLFAMLSVIRTYLILPYRWCSSKQSPFPTHSISCGISLFRPMRAGKKSISVCQTTSASWQVPRYC